MTNDNQVDELNQTLEHESGEPPSGSPGAGRRTGKWRVFVAALLIVIAAILAPGSVVAAWARDEVGNTDRYVATVAPLSSDPAVQQAAITRITNEIFSRLNVDQLGQSAAQALQNLGLPPRVATGLTALAQPLASGVESFITEQVTKFVESEAFQKAWIAANREAHAALVAVLSGQGSDKVNVSNGTVSVNLAAVIDTIKTELVNSGFSLASNIPEVNAQFTIFESADLAKGQRAYRLLNKGAFVLPVVVLLLLAIAIYISRSRRKALLWSAVAIGIGMVVLGLSLNIFRTIYLNALPSTVSAPAATSIYDALVNFIRLNLRAVLVVALAVGVGAWVTGLSASAVATRGVFNRAINSVRGGADSAGVKTGPVGEFAAKYHTPLRVGILAVAVLVYVQAAHPTGAWTLKVLVITLVLLLLVELIARPALITASAKNDLTRGGGA
jgi:hypothetical protein